MLFRSGKTVLWDVSSKEVLQVMSGHDGAVLGVDVASDDQTIATCGMDKTIKIWKRQPLLTNGHSEPPPQEQATFTDEVQDSHQVPAE